MVLLPIYSAGSEFSKEIRVNRRTLLKSFPLLRNCPKDAFFRFGFPRVGRPERDCGQPFVLTPSAKL